MTDRMLHFNPVDYSGGNRNHWLLGQSAHLCHLYPAQWADLERAATERGVEFFDVWMSVSQPARPLGLMVSLDEDGQSDVWWDHVAFTGVQRAYKYGQLIVEGVWGDEGPDALRGRPKQLSAFNIVMQEGQKIGAQRPSAMDTYFHNGSNPEHYKGEDLTPVPLPIGDIEIPAAEWQRSGSRWYYQGLLPEEYFHRPKQGKPLLFIRRYRNGRGVVRAFGDQRLQDGMTIGNVRIPYMTKAGAGWVALLEKADIAALISGQAQTEQAASIPSHLRPLILSEIRQGAQWFDSRAVAALLRESLPPHRRNYGNCFMDGGYVALTPAGLRKFLAVNDVDSVKYVSNDKGYGFDCDNFAINLKADLARDYKVNSCGVICGNGHAWNFFVVHERGELGMVMVEPQNDAVLVNRNHAEGIYGWNRRCEIII